jgi:glycosyltransferase involved in cell wall biosynthesis
MTAETHKVDIIIPVYKEGDAVLPTLVSIGESVKSPHQILICYDMDDDPTIAAVSEYVADGRVQLVKNTGVGAHGAVTTGFAAATADWVIVIPADDDYNAVLLDRMIDVAEEGADVVCASRFMAGGCMEGCRFLKAFLVRVAAFTLYHFGRLPTHDATNGFRLFSRRLIREVVIESTQGFTYSLELLAKSHSMRWPVAEVPASWFERKQGQSRFRVISWIPAYLRWYFYVFATTWLRRGPGTVKRNVT